MHVSQDHIWLGQLIVPHKQFQAGCCDCYNCYKGLDFLIYMRCAYVCKTSYVQAPCNTSPVTGGYTDHAEYAQQHPGTTYVPCRHRDIWYVRCQLMGMMSVF